MTVTPSPRYTYRPAEGGGTRVMEVFDTQQRATILAVYESYHNRRGLILPDADTLATDLCARLNAEHDQAVEAERLNSELLDGLAEQLEGKTPAELQAIQQKLTALLSLPEAP
ncbi:hypothetical protein [Deinococcus sp. QL22]|uniref:hypothetical protein n=1 Tax=Deinococcus sp. QL22 TaxID=2939437 RepID=UPI002017BE9B|nr:hypothetical protein [Deinococcus sp. QL22]UQN10388.1 hypothetical protein M1R55_30000 [Deinococcus sp. QL22]UQN10522.1 hypothetical protein M1R55_29325 [Deinococcus sp. QL22]